MKRPPGIWFLLSAGVLWLSIHNVYGLKATELIFKKTTSTTTTTETTPITDEVSTEAAVEAANATKSYLTGNPQLDYIYDPNLPRELNGYNLSSYPFYNLMPDNITFKCDGLHDGFYASIPHKCQVYHHCLSGIRYDFLCANYTAFDQKIFNCHFVSEVDCENSQKFWHRNDALYEPASTTTVKPPPVVISPALTASRRPQPPLGRRRTPPRKRPQYEYYDDEEYDDADKEEYYEPPPPRRRRKRPRPRPRPIYEEDYEEYEDRNERRSSARRNEDKRRDFDEEDKADDRRMTDDKQEKRYDKRKQYEERRYKDDRRREYEQDEEEEEDYPRRRPSEKRRPYYERPRKPTRRPHDDDIYEDEKSEEKHPQKEKSNKVPKVQPDNAGVTLVKPNGPSSVYNQPRMPPRIKPPVPKNVHKLTTSSEKPVTVKKLPADEEYYDEYEDEIAVKRTTTTTTKAPAFETSSKRQKIRTTQKPTLYSDEYETEHPLVKKSTVNAERETNIRFSSPKFIPKEARTKITTTTSTLPPSTTINDILIPTTTITTTTTTTTTTEAPRERVEPVVRVVKRPFLPSRGGNPYSVRGLQPVGAKALDTSQFETDLPSIPDKYENMQPIIQNGRQFPIPANLQQTQPVLKEPLEVKPIAVLESGVEPIRLQIPNRTKFISRPEEPPRVKPKVPEKNPLDINENEYDVTLNDALNPTLPNLPVRNFPSGFGFAPSDYFYNTLQRQRYDGYNVSPESFHPKTVKQRDETIVAQPQTYRNNVYNNQNFRSNPQLTQANTQGFYRVYQS